MREAKIKATVEKLNEILDAEKRVHKDIDFKSHDGHRYLELVRKVRCKDGFEVSIQASHTHYCTPRDSEGPWSEVELGFPNKHIPSLRQYRDGDAPDMGNVFGYVPIEKVAALIIRHGGIVGFAS